MIQILDHAARAFQRLASFLKESDSHVGFAAIIGKQIQELETVFFSLLVMREIDTATAGQLDQLGELVGAVRPIGGTDAAYRLRIKARILSNRTTGTATVMLRLLRLLAPPFTNGILTNDWDYGFGNDPYEADITIRQTDSVYLTTQAAADEMVQAFAKARPAGVALSFHYSLTPTNFLFDGGDAIDGFGDTGNPSTGNPLMGALRG